MSGMADWQAKISIDIEDLKKRVKVAEGELDKITKEDRKIKLDLDTKTLESAIQKLDKMLDSLGKGTGDFKQLESLSKELSTIVNEVQSLSKAFGKVDDSGAKTLLSFIQNIDKSLSDLSQNILNVNKNMSNMGSNTSGAVRQVENIGNAAADAEKQVDKLAEAQSKLGNKTNISSGNSSTASAEKFQQITSDTVNVLSDVGKTEDQIIQKIQKERSEAEANNEVLREHLVLLDKAGKVVANHWGSTSNVNGTYTDEQLSQAQGGKIIHAHPGKASFFGGQDLKHLLQDSMYDQIKQIDLIWGDSALSVDKSTLTKESSGTLLNIMRNVRKTLTEAYGDNPDGAPSQEAREHINAIEKEIFKTIAQKLNVSVSEEGNMAKEVTDALSDVDKSIIKRFSEIKDSVIKDTDASSIIKNQMKDAFQGDEVEKASEAISNAVKEENNILEQNTQKAKENAEAKEKMANADKEVSNANFSKYDNRLESYNKKTSGYDATIARFEDGGWTSDAYLKNVQAVKDAVKEYENILNDLKTRPELVTEKELNKLDEQEKLIKENITAVQNMSAAEKGFTLLSGQKAMDKINSILKENSAMSKQAKNQIRAWYNEIDSGNPSKNLSQILGEVQKIVNAEAEAGRAGKSMIDSIKEKAWYGVASAIGTYFGFNDFLRYGREAIDTVVQLDDALVDLKKTTSMSSSELENFYYDANDVAKQMGVTTEEIISQASAWSRLNKIGLLYGDI